MTFLKSRQLHEMANTKLIVIDLLLLKLMKVNSSKASESSLITLHVCHGC